MLKKIVLALLALVLLLVGCNTGNKELTEQEYRKEVNKLRNQQLDIMMDFTFEDGGDHVSNIKKVANSLKDIAEKLEEIKPPVTIETRVPEQHKWLALGIKFDSEFYFSYYEYVKEHEDDQFGTNHDFSLAIEAKDYYAKAKDLRNFLDAE